MLHDQIPNFVKEANRVNQDTPFFIAHGDADQVVRYDWGAESARVIKEDLGHKVEFKTYADLPHSAALEEIDDLEKWISTCLEASPAAAAESGEGKSSI